jgi:adenylate cyclase
VPHTCSPSTTRAPQFGWSENGILSANFFLVLAKRFLVISALALLTFVAISVADLTHPFAYVRLRNLYRDAVSRAGKTAPANPGLVFLAIDAASVNLDESDIKDLFGLDGSNFEEVYALRLMSTRFPWPREVYALILERLVRAGARVVVFDLNLQGPSDDDPGLRVALDRYSDRVVIGSNFVDGTLTRPSDTLVPQTYPMDDRVGFTNFWADDDDVVRCARYRVTFEEVREMQIKAGSERFLSLAAATLAKAGFGVDLPAALEDHPLRFTAAPRRGFPPHSVFEIFVPAYWRQNYQSGEFFRNKIVIVGAEGNWQHDEHPTPFGNMPGAELHLNAMNAALQHQFVHELPQSASSLFTALAGCIAIFASLLLRSPWLRVSALLILSTGAVAFGLLCFNFGSFYLPMVAPLAQLNTTMLLGLVCDFTTERIEKTRVRRVLERYVSRDVVSEMVDRPSLYTQSLGGVTKPVAILFSDIRSYSVVTAQSSPEMLVAQLNEYFTSMVDCVFQYGGTLDKFIGDAVMAVWGSLHSHGPLEDAIAAVNAALAMQEKLAVLNKTWRERGWPQLRVGMAVNYGEVVVGNIGSPQRMEFTVIGDAVNVAWKLQELTKKSGARVMVSGSVAALTAEHFELRSLGSLVVDKSHAVCEVYAVEQAISAGDFPDARLARTQPALG